MGATNYNCINWWRVFSINSSVFNFTLAFLIAAENIEFYQLRPGILCVDVHKTEGNRVVTGGVDAQARQMRPPAFLQSSFRESESSPFMPIPFAPVLAVLDRWCFSWHLLHRWCFLMLRKDRWCRSWRAMPRRWLQSVSMRPRTSCQGGTGLSSPFNGSNSGCLKNFMISLTDKMHLTCWDV